jgi:hypothetical protein
MFRFLFRFVGLVSLAAAFCILIIDGVKSIADSKIHISNVQYLWNEITPASLQNVRIIIENRVGGWAWDPVFVGFLTAPSWAVLGLAGILLILMGRKKRPLIGYAR